MRLIDADALISAIEKGEGISWERYGDNEVCVRKKYIDNAQAVNLPNYGSQVVPDVLQGWKYEERPLYEGVLFVDDYGINKVIKLDEDGTITAQMVIPRDAFIEAYNKFIKGE